MAPSTPPNISPITADSDTFKGTPAEGVTTISTGHEGGSGGRIASFGAVTIAEQNARALAATEPPALRTPESAAAARAGLATPAATDTAPSPAAEASDAAASSSTPATGSDIAGSPASARGGFGRGGASGTGV